MSNTRSLSVAFGVQPKAAENAPSSREARTWMRPLSSATPSARQATAFEIESWDELVSRFEGARLVHKLAWVRSLEGSGLGKPLFIVFEREGHLVGCLPGLITNVGPLRIFGSPLPGSQTAGMGPLFDDTRITSAELTSALVRFLERHHRVHHIELVSSSLEHAAMRAAGFTGSTVPTSRCPLFAEESAQRKALKESARRNIRRAVGLGIVVRFEEDERFVDEHYDQLREVFTRGGNKIPFSRRRVLAYFQHMKASGNLLAVAAYLPTGECIATGTFTVEGNELLLWNWTHRTRYRWYRPTELMTWTVMRRAAELGCTTFDLMGRGDFKTKLGAQLDETRYRWVRSRYEWIRQLRDFAEKAYRRQQAARGRLARTRLEFVGWVSRRGAAEGGAPSSEGSGGGDS